MYRSISGGIVVAVRQRLFGMEVTEEPHMVDAMTQSFFGCYLLTSLRCSTNCPEEMLHGVGD